MKGHLKKKKKRFLSFVSYVYIISPPKDEDSHKLLPGK
jgi:hypothetical protein